jgi:hypothetical protein
MEKDYESLKVELGEMLAVIAQTMKSEFRRLKGEVNNTIGKLEPFVAQTTEMKTLSADFSKIQANTSETEKDYWSLKAGLQQLQEMLAEAKEFRLQFLDKGKGIPEAPQTFPIARQTTW